MDDQDRRDEASEPEPTENADDELESKSHATEELPPPLRGGYFDKISKKLRSVWHPRR
jgi:hypothetical protein